MSKSRLWAMLATAALLTSFTGAAGATTIAPDSRFSADPGRAEEFATYLDTKWGGPLGTGATVTYSFMADGIGCGGGDGACGGGTIAALSSFMPAGWKNAIESAFAAWSAVAGLTFVEVADTGEDFNAAGSSGDIRLGGHAFDGIGGTLAHGYYPPPNGLSAAGDIHFDTAETWKTDFGGGGFDIFQVAAHEIGHAIGLGHSGVTGSLMNAFYTEAFSGPQADDIAGARYLYGAPAAAPVPLPAGLPLLAAAVAGLAALRRRRHRPA